MFFSPLQSIRYDYSIPDRITEGPPAQGFQNSKPGTRNRTSGSERHDSISLLEKLLLLSYYFEDSARSADWDPSEPQRRTPQEVRLDFSALTLGVEEEYQIIDPDTRELTSYVGDVLEQGAVIFRDQVKPELLQSQVEIGSHMP